MDKKIKPEEMKAGAVCEAQERPLIEELILNTLWYLKTRPRPPHAKTLRPEEEGQENY